MIMNTVLKVYVPAQAFLKHQAMLFAKRTEGASGIEYALIAGMVAVALVAFVPTISAAVTAMFTQIEGAL
ncbi:hypothetical protein AWM69_15845 [Pseudomonas sp. D1HM]|nr:hypothetical protein [Pseudomonas sp. D1HM]